MITIANCNGQSYAVLGLGHSGLSAAAALLASGARVCAWDDCPEARRQAVQLGADIGDLCAQDLTQYAAVVVAPGVPLNRHPITLQADAASVSVIGDIELFACACATLPPHKIVGVTGTNGKSTVASLIHHIISVAGVPTAIGGNIGVPILSCDPLTAGGIYVLEVSSFQLDTTHSLACDVAVLTNISPDHCDRYDDFDDYSASKARIFALQRPGQQAIIGGDDQPSQSLAIQIERQSQLWLERVTQESLVRYGYARSEESVAIEGVVQNAAPDKKHRQIRTSPSDWPALVGLHNARNAACAIAACRALSISQEAIIRGLRSYGGLPHRMEFIVRLAGVDYYNDSKATNAVSAAAALASFPPLPAPHGQPSAGARVHGSRMQKARIHWILGGAPKGDGLAACHIFFDHIHRAYLIGAAQDAFARDVGAVLTVEKCGTLDKAVASAAQHARAGDVILFSPACASFDQYQDYVHRGDSFRALVKEVAKEIEQG